jgi:hypothetical protein
MFIVALFKIAKKRKETKCPLTDGWIKESGLVYIKESYSSLKN